MLLKEKTVPHLKREDSAPHLSSTFIGDEDRIKLVYDRLECGPRAWIIVPTFCQHQTMANHLGSH